MVPSEPKTEEKGRQREGGGSTSGTIHAMPRDCEVGPLYVLQICGFGLNLSAVSGYFPHFSAVNGYGLLRNRYDYSYGLQNFSVSGYQS